MNPIQRPRLELLQRGSHAILLGIAVAALYGGGCKRGERPPEAGPIAARVNGEPIPWARVTPQVEKDLARLKKHGASSSAPDLVRKTQRQRLEAAIDEELLLQESRKLTVEDLEAKIASQLAATAGAEPSAPTAAPAVADPERRQKIRDQILVDAYLKRSGLAEPPIPEEEVRKLFETSKESFRRPESLRAAHILLKLPPNPAPAEREVAARKLRKLRAEIASGSIAFEEAARLHSECASARNGGDLGELKKGFMPKSFEAAAAKLKEGELSDLVQTEHGLHVLKVLHRTPASEPEYEAVRDLLVRYLKGGASQQVLASHLQQLRGRAKIEIYASKVDP